MHKTALDFLTFTLVMCVITVLSFNITLPIVKKTKELYYSEMYDKTIGKPYGELATIYSKEDDGMSKNEVILQMIGQNHFMPSPGRIEICGTKIDITNNLAFSPNSADLGATVNSIIENWFTEFKSSSTINKFEKVPATIDEAQFKLMFDMNDANDSSDNSYSLYIRLKLKGKDYKWFKCTANGHIEY